MNRIEVKETIIRILNQVTDELVADEIYNDETIQINKCSTGNDGKEKLNLILSSLEIIDLIVEIENHFSVTFDEKDILGFETIGDLIDMTENYIVKNTD